MISPFKTYLVDLVISWSKSLGLNWYPILKSDKRKKKPNKQPDRLINVSHNKTVSLIP